MAEQQRSSRFDDKTYRQAMEKGFTGLMWGLAFGILFWFLVLVLVCWLRQEPSVPGYYWWYIPARGSIWNLLILVPAGLGTGCLAGFIIASYGEEQQRLGQVVKAVPAVLGGVAAADVLRGPNSYLITSLNEIANVCGRGTSGGLVFLILLAFFSHGFLILYILKAAFLNPLIEWASPRLFTNEEDAKKAQVEGIGRDPETIPEKSSQAKSGTMIQDADSPARDPSDPQLGRWGGRSLSGGYVLLAAVTQADSNAKYFKVHLWVRTIDSESKVVGPVIFHLHPTFTQSDVKVDPVDGVATLERLAWGAFTVGVEISGGVRLELDLSKPADFPKEFRER